VAADSAEQREIARLTAEVTRLRELERGLRRERERVRAEAAVEIQRLQAALREAAMNAGALDAELEREAEDADARQERLAAREAELTAAAARLRDAEAQLEEERRRLSAWRRRLEQESERLAEWERSARAAPAPEQGPATFEEGLRRLSEPGAARGTSW
jgi:DNA repair exonuclease SbcCD ATPase subunit